MQKPCAICATRTDNGRHRQVARKILSAIRERGVIAISTDAGHKRGAERRNNLTIDAAAYSFYISIQGTPRSHGGVSYYGRSSKRLACLLWASLLANLVELTRYPSTQEEKKH